MLTNSFLLVHKDEDVLSNALGKILCFCTSFNYASDRMLVVQCYLDEKEIRQACNDEPALIFKCDNEQMDVNSLLDKILDKGMDSLSSDERLYLYSLHQS